MNDAAYDILVGRIYAMAVDAEAAPAMLACLGEAFGASACTLGVQDLVSHDILRTSVGTSDEMARDCSEYYRFRNPFLAAAARMPVGSVFHPEDLLPSETIRRDEYVNDYLIRHDVPQVMALKLWQGQRVLATLNVMRGRRLPGFGQDERRMACRLVPHLQRAIAMRQRVGLERRMVEATTSRLAAQGTVILLLKEDGRVPDARPEAAALLLKAGGLLLTSTGLHAHDPMLDARLASLVALATRGDARGRRVGGSMAIPRHDARPLVVLVSPLRTSDGAFEHYRAVVTITDPDQGTVPPPDLLRRLYGLTGSEAGVALCLAAGKTLAEAAGQMNLTVGSARQYLQRAFGKMQVDRQAELVRLVAGLAGGTSREGH